MQAYLSQNPGVTFFKKVYNRHTRLNSWKTNYLISPDTNVLEIDFSSGSELNLTNPLVLLKNLWIETNTESFDQIGKISTILVPEFEVPYTFEIVKYKEYNNFFPFVFNNPDAQQEPNLVQPEPFDWNEFDKLQYAKLNNLEQEEQNPHLDEEYEQIRKSSGETTGIKKLVINPSASLEEILSIKNTMLVSSLGINMLKFVESYKDFKKSNYLQIPISDIAFVSELIKKSKYRLIIHFEKFQPVPISLVAKYSMIQDPNEIIFFNQRPHEYLIKRYVETSMDIGSNSNSNQILINPHFTQIPLCTLVISSPVRLEEITVKATDGIEYKFVCSQTNPENPVEFVDLINNSAKTTGWFSGTEANPNNQYRWFYTLDQLVEKLGFDCTNYQPVGSYTFDQSNPIKIKFPTGTKSKSVKLDFMYLSYDVVRYIGDNFITLLSYMDMYKQQISKASHEQMDQLILQEKLLSFEEFATCYYSWVKSVDLVSKHFACAMTSNPNPNSLITYTKYKDLHKQAHPELYPVNPEPEVQAPINPEPHINPNIDQIFGPPMRSDLVKFEQILRYIQLYSYYVVPVFKATVELMEYFDAKKLALEDNTICEILLEPIKPGSYYHKCETCNGVFDSHAYKTWIEDSTKNCKCPKCQTQIIQIPSIYLNSKENIIEKFSWLKPAIPIVLIGIVLKFYF